MGGGDGGGEKGSSVFFFRGIGAGWFEEVDAFLCGGSRTGRLEFFFSAAVGRGIMQGIE